MKLKNKMVVSCVVSMLLFTGCTDYYKMRWGKSEQFCHDNNTSAFDFSFTGNNTRIVCKNGFEKTLTSEEFKEITGPEVSKAIDNFWFSDLQRDGSK